MFFEDKIDVEFKYNHWYNSSGTAITRNISFEYFYCDFL